jgi:molecular chaperone HtpG
VDYRFQVNLGGVINLLANNLYSGPKVFLRELMQNAVDAIRARENLGQAGYAGRVSIEVVPGEKGAAPTLICEDNGVGLTEDEVHRFLATIGESSKRGDLGEARSDFIGQFGIGLLSCFMVADEIVVITRAVKEPGKATEWRGRPDGTYTVKALPGGDGEPGTRVFLRAKKDKETKELFAPKGVRELAEKYGGLLPYPVTVSAGKQTSAVNAEAPWERAYPSAAKRREALLAYGKDVFDTDFFDCVPLESKAGDVRGVAFVLPYSPSPAAKGRHRIYLKRMLLSEAGEGVLPEWAFFVRCVINANGLRPTASREAFYEDDALAAARLSLGDALRSYLVEMAATEPARLSKLITLHYLAIKALAVYDEEFYRIFIDWIPFETSLGTMTMRDLRKQPSGPGGKAGVVRFVPTVDEFRQVARVAAAQDLCVVNAGYTYNQELLLRLPEVFDDVTVEEVGAASLAQSFAEVSLEEREACFDLLRAADAALAPFKCAGDVRRFEPAELAALFTTDPDGALYRAAEQGKDLGPTNFTGIIDNLLGGPARSNEPRAHLLLNYNSALVQRLAVVKDAAMLRRCVEMLYVQALLLGHHPLSSRELSLLNEGLSSLINVAVDAGGKPPKEA